MPHKQSIETINRDMCYVGLRHTLPPQALLCFKSCVIPCSPNAWSLFFSRFKELAWKWVRIRMRLTDGTTEASILGSQSWRLRKRSRRNNYTRHVAEGNVEFAKIQDPAWGMLLVFFRRYSTPTRSRVFGRRTL